MKYICATIAVAIVLPLAANGAPRTVVSHLPGLSCMSLRITDRQAMDPHFVVPIQAEPSDSAPAIGRASAIVLVREPQVEQNGFVAALLFNGRPGWIAASDIKPWVNPAGNGQRCIPSRMSDGSIGLDFQ